MALLHFEPWRNRPAKGAAKLAPRFAKLLAKPQAMRGFSEILASAHEGDDTALAQAQTWAASAQHCLFLGIGGSALSPACLMDWQRTPRDCWFSDGLDVASLRQKLESLVLGENPAQPPVRIIALSKSGNTKETLGLLEVSLDFLRQRGVKESALPDLVAVITQKGNNLLAGQARKLGLSLFPLPREPGSRFSMFTNLGRIPAALAGMDYQSVRTGALYQAENVSAQQAQSAAELAGAMQQGRLPVLLLHDPILFPFGRWWQQIMAESLGKQGQGKLPMVVYCPADQHSLFQLFLGGGDEFYFTSLCLPPLSEPSNAAEKLMTAQQQAAQQMLQEAGRTGRTLSLARRDEFGFGALLMQVLLEVFLLADGFGISAIGQPEIERGKKILAAL